MKMLSSSLCHARHSGGTSHSCHYRGNGITSLGLLADVALPFPTPQQQRKYDEEQSPQGALYVKLCGPSASVGRSGNCPLSLKIKPCASGRPSQSPVTMLTKIYEF